MTLSRTSQHILHSLGTIVTSTGLTFFALPGFPPLSIAIVVAVLIIVVTLGATDVTPAYAWTGLVVPILLIPVILYVIVPSLTSSSYLAKLSNNNNGRGLEQNVMEVLANNNDDEVSEEDEMEVPDDWKWDSFPGIPKKTY